MFVIINNGLLFCFYIKYQGIIVNQHITTSVETSVNEYNQTNGVCSEKTNKQTTSFKCNNVK
jgi:hypothetical protein